MPTACDNYDLAEAKFKAFTRSSIRTKVTLCFLKGNLNAGDMQEEPGSRATILKTAAKNYMDLGRVSQKYDNLRLYSRDVKVKEAFAVTDTILFLDLFRLSGDYDVSNYLICRGYGAEKRSMELFNYYLSISNECIKYSEHWIFYAGVKGPSQSRYRYRW